MQNSKCKYQLPYYASQIPQNFLNTDHGNWETTRSRRIGPGLCFEQQIFLGLVLYTFDYQVGKLVTIEDVKPTMTESVGPGSLKGVSILLTQAGNSPSFTSYGREEIHLLTG